jgi:hypothetical protein
MMKTKLETSEDENYTRYECKFLVFMKSAVVLDALEQLSTLLNCSLKKKQISIVLALLEQGQ